MGAFVPSFGPSKKAIPGEILHNGRSSFIHRTEDKVWMSVGSKWSKSLAALARRFEIDGLLVSTACAAGGLGFLDELPGLKALDVSVPNQTLDWRPVERMKCLEELNVSSAPIVRTVDPGEIDFAALPSLISCVLSKFHPQWASVFGCAGLKRLHLTTAELSKLDLGTMPKLAELVLGGMPKLASFSLAKSSKLKALQLRTCKKLMVDWPRVGRDLLYLWVERKPAWPLSELRFAPKLQWLMLSYCGKIESVDFLDDLPKLRNLDLFLTEFNTAGYERVRARKNLQASLPGSNPEHRRRSPRH